jgi:hypothetical protein
MPSRVDKRNAKPAYPEVGTTLSEISQDTPKDSKGKIFIRTIGVQSLDHHFAALFQCLNGFCTQSTILVLRSHNIDISRSSLEVLLTRCNARISKCIKCES